MGAMKASCSYAVSTLHIELFISYAISSEAAGVHRHLVELQNASLGQPVNWSWKLDFVIV